MKIVVIDGQGGRIGSLLTGRLCKEQLPNCELYAIGTNATATAAMLKAGADFGATGENPVIYNAQSADVIIGPIGIVLANSLLGEITPAMAAAVAQSDAQKILIPMNRCKSAIAGVLEAPLAEYIELAANLLQKFLADKI